MGLADALKGGLRGAIAQAPGERGREVFVPQSEAAPVYIPAREKTGKCSDPGFQRVGVYVRKSTKKTAERMWDDAGGGDLSELVERLLSDYVSKGLRD